MRNCPAVPRKQPFTVYGAYSLSASSSSTFPDIGVPFRAGHFIVSSYSLLLTGYVLLIAIYGRKKPLAGMRDVPIYEYINKSLGII